MLMRKRCVLISSDDKVLMVGSAVQSNVCKAQRSKTSTQPPPPSLLVRTSIAFSVSILSVSVHSSQIYWGRTPAKLSAGLFGRGFFEDGPAADDWFSETADDLLSKAADDWFFETADVWFFTTAEGFFSKTTDDWFFKTAGFLELLVEFVRIFSVFASVTFLIRKKNEN